MLGAAAVAFAYLGYVYLTLPDVRALAKENPPTTAFIELRLDEARYDGRTKFAIRQKWIPYNQIAPALRRAVLVTEDAAFFDHDGIDLDEIKASLERNWEAGRVRPAVRARSPSSSRRTCICHRLAIRFASCASCSSRGGSRRALTKRRILEIYLNVIEWGDGIFGAEAAARAYFGKTCRGPVAPRKPR